MLSAVLLLVACPAKSTEPDEPEPVSSPSSSLDRDAATALAREALLELHVDLEQYLVEVEDDGGRWLVRFEGLSLRPGDEYGVFVEKTTGKVSVMRGE